MPAISKRKKKVISLDTETTGLDLHHIAKPFLVTSADENGITHWEWFVNPVNRQPVIPDGEIEEVVELIESADEIIFQNVKYDIQALATVGVFWKDEWWDKIQDCIYADHLLNSSELHSLDNQAVRYLMTDINKYENKMEEAVKEARKIAKDEFPHWLIAKAGLPGMPSIKTGDTKKAEEKPWKNDTWLPRLIAREKKYQLTLEKDGSVNREKSHPWWYVTADYANVDSEATLAIWNVQKDLIQKRGLWKIYEERIKVARVIAEIEINGMTYDDGRRRELVKEFTEESESRGRVCVSLSDGKLDSLPAAGTTKAMRELMFDVWKMPVLERSEKTGQPTVDKQVLEQYEASLPRGSKALAFIKNLRVKRKRDKSLSDMETYDKFGVKVAGYKETKVLHTSLNPADLVTLRLSSSNPNNQAVSKDHFAGARSVRYIFGPAPDREWWSLDYQNIELRIPAYEAPEPDMIQLFERPNDPPYYGSNHLVTFSVLHPEKWAEHGAKCKDIYKDTWYQWTKSGNFAIACTPLSTKALTKNGWKSHNEIKVGDEVLGYNQQSGLMEWTDVKRVVYKTSALVRLSNNHFEATVTPDHKWVGTRRTGRGKTRRYVKEFFQTNQVHGERSIILSAPMADNNHLLTPDEAALIGLIYGDGCIESKEFVGNNGQSNGKKVGFRIRIFQKKKKGITFIKKTLKGWGGTFYTSKKKDGVNVFSLDSQDARDLFEKAGLLRVKKKTNPEKWQKFVLSLGNVGRESFLQGVFVAEGTFTTKHNRKVYYQNDSCFSDAIRMALFLNGNFPTAVIRKDYYGTKEKALSISGCKPLVTGRRMVYENLPEEKVWCLTTGLGTWVMKQENGLIMITGNCGAMETEDGWGTADKAFHVKFAQQRLKSRFVQMAALKERIIEHANKYGFVNTMVDKELGAAYPIQIKRNRWGRISPTLPFSYHVQSTAMWAMYKAMNRVSQFLKKWNADNGYVNVKWFVTKTKKLGGFITMQVHDELVLDLPKKEGGQKEVIMEVKRLMEKSGDDIGVPLGVDYSYHPNNWDEKEKA